LEIKVRKFSPVLGTLELANHKDIADFDLRIFLWRASYYGGFEAVRTFPDWICKGGGNQPHLMVGNLYAIKKLNQAWIDQMLKIKGFAKKVGMKMDFDPFDSCALRYDWCAWRRGRNVEKTDMWDLSDNGIAIKKFYLEALIEAFGTDINWGLCNEPFPPDLFTGAMWAFKMAEILRAKGAIVPSSKKLWLNGYNHKFCGALSDEKPDGLPAYYMYPNDSHICVYHVVGKPSQVVRPFSSRMMLTGFSDDGCNFKDEPMGVRGHAEGEGTSNPSNYGPSGESRKRTIKEICRLWTKMEEKPPDAGRVGQFSGDAWISYEVLPREIQVSGTMYSQMDLNKLDVEDTIKSIARAYKALYGEWPKNWHKYPKPK
jgi:hypothetical protein